METSFAMWAAWAVLLIAQNAAFTTVSRARNSGSLKYHAIAAFFSNGIWMVSFVIVFDLLQKALASGSFTRIAATVLFYTVFTMTGSLVAHYVLRTKVEKGKLKVGA